MTRQNQKLRSVSRYSIWVALVIIACDPFAEDYIEDKNLVTFGQTEYYIVPGSSVVIDLNSVVKRSFINATIKISRQPERGHLIALDAMLLKYEPSGSFFAGSDSFILSVFQEEALISDVTIVMIMKSTVDDFPCKLSAVGDFVLTDIDSTTSVRFLDNDRICGTDQSSLLHSIYIKPKHGKATLHGDSIVYEPESGYMGKDSLVYKISSSDSGSEDVSFGTINVKIGNNHYCAFQIQGSYLIDLSDSVFESLTLSDWCGYGYQFPILAGLGTCEDLSITMGPFVDQTGGFCLDDDFQVVMFMPQLNSSENPTAQLRICLNENCKIVALNVILENDNHPDWLPGWTASNINTGDDDLSTIVFVDNEVGYAGGSSSLYKTVDGGKNWTPLIFEVPSKNGVKGSLRGLDFLNADDGFAAYGIYDDATQTYGGGVMRTTDGGQSWISTTSFEGQYVYGVDFVTSRIGFVAVEDFMSTNGVHILKTTNRGESWKTVLRAESIGAVPKIQFMKNGNTGYVLHFSTIFKTVDSGETWQISFENIHSNKYWTILDIALASKTGIVMANALHEFKSDLYRSETGLTWAKVRTDFPGQEVLSPSGSLGIHYSRDYGNFISTDFAQTWQKANIPVSLADGFVPGAASIPSEYVAYLLDRHGKVLRFVKE